MASEMTTTQYSFAFEHSLDAVFLSRPDCAIFAANPAACQQLGLTG